MKKMNTKRKKILKKVIAVTTALVLTTGFVPMPEVVDEMRNGIFEINHLLNAHAASNHTISTIEDLNAFVDEYTSANANDTITIHCGDKLTIPNTFPGIGTESAPFKGKIQIMYVTDDNGGASRFLQLKAPLFNYISDEATIVDQNELSCTLYLFPDAIDSEEEYKPLFANHVAGTGGSADWNIKVYNTDITANDGAGAEEINDRNSLIGEIYYGTSSPNVAIEYTNQSASIKGEGDLGLICNKISSGSLTVSLQNGADAPIIKSGGYNYSANNESVTAEGGNVGGLVGTISHGASLTINTDINYSNKRTIETSNGYAGGLVGKCEGTISLGTDVTYNDSMYSDIIGTDGAGGLFGFFGTTTNTTIPLEKYTITSRQGDSVDPGQGIKADETSGKTGGVIGELVNNGSSATINISGPSGAVNSSVPIVDVSLFGKYGGGIIGYYNTDSLANSLIINNIFCNSEGSMAVTYGGIVGKVASTNDCGAYINLSNVKSKSTAYPLNSNIDYKRKNSTSAGGIADIKNSFVDITNTVKIDTGTINVGLIYNSDGGVIRFAGVTDLSSLTVGDKLNGLLVNNRNNTLIYALGNGTNYNDSAGTGWNYIRPSLGGLDDINSWGQVIRYVSTSSAANLQTIEEASVVTVDDTAHTVTIAAADTSMETSADFAKTALNIKLNTTGSDFGALKFTSGSANQSSTLLASSMSLEKNIDLSGSGITGLTKDNGSNNVFASTFDGKGHTIKLATGEAYGYKGNISTAASITNGSAYPMTGAIQKHNYSGLFAKLGAANVKDLTISGTINSSGTYIGGLAAELNGATTTLTNVDTSAQLIINSFGGTNIGFLIGNINDGVAANLGMTDSDIEGTIYSRTKSATIGAIGKVADKNITINTNNISLKASIDYSAAGSASIGGLIGEAASGGSGRKFNLNNIDIDGMSIRNENSSGGIESPAGGLLGGKWYDTAVIFKDSSHTAGTDNGVTVTDGTLTLTGTNNTYAGGLVAEATGYWQVNDVDIDGMTLSGASSALGLLVMRGKNGRSGTSGLYLELTSPSAYSIDSSGLNLPDSITVFDEIMAYSKSVETTTVNDTTVYAPSETNGQAIISIRTSNTDGKPKLSMGTDNSYQPKTTLGSQHNPFSRYYYNLDYLLTNASTGGEKLLLWSINKYAASNIASNNQISSARAYDFSHYSTFPSESDLDLSYLSYYPVDVSEEALSITGKTITFKNYDMQSAHGGTYSLNTLDDSYNISQHYLMHAGLFKNNTYNLSLSNITLRGTVSAHEGSTTVPAGSGAILCGNVVGAAPNSKATLTINGLSLDGLSVNGSTGVDALIVKKIGSNTNISISQVSTTDQYVTDGTVNAAKYLMGDAAGTAMTIVFDKMVLDGRTSSSSLYNQSATSGTPAYDLNQTYHTYQSIFSDSTFLRSLNYVTGSGSSAKYDYKWNEDWGPTKHQVTYGKEISDTLENRDEGVSKQSKYVDRYNDVYTSPESDAWTSGAYSFSNFLPHVDVSYDSSTNYHEVAVNIVSDVLDKGCGTYNDPYIVNGAQLKVIADILSDTGTNTGISNGFYLNIDNDYLTATDKYNFERNCENKSGHTKFTYTSGTNLSGKLDGKTISLNVQYVKDYLAGAYYYIESPITLPSDYPGLGGALNRFAFRGVIVGADGVTIENQSPFPLVKISNGCVVKDLTINVTNSSITKSAETKTTFNYNTTTEYYGGVIGEIMAGDNIIDNVKVHYSHPITVSGAFKQDVPVGGYIGVVVNGSVFFRNMETINASNNAVSINGVNDPGMYFRVIDSDGNDNLQNEVIIDPSTGTENFYSLYANPIIGRVINGFAINETDTYRFSEDGQYVDYSSTNGRTRGNDSNKVSLNNNRKNFSIPDFNSTSMLLFSASDSIYDTITANDAQSLYILSLICQTNMGSAANDDPSVNEGKYTSTLGYDSTASNSTKYRATHLADYEGVGKLTLNPVSNPGTEPIQGISESDEDFAERHSAWEAASTSYTAWVTELTNWNTAYTSDFNKTKDEKTHSPNQVPYLIYAYTNSYTNDSGHTCYPARTVINSGRSWDLNLKALGEDEAANTYYLPDSFRGIGSIANTSYCPSIKNFNGNANIIDVNTYVRTYTTAYDNHSTISGGIGLFNCLKQTGVTITDGKPGNGSNTIGNFTLSGYISGKRTLGAWNAVQMATNASDILVSGLAPVNSSDYNIAKIKFNNLNIDGSNNAGSLFANVTNNFTMCVNNCDADKLKVTGYGSVGGLIGRLDKNLYLNTIDNAKSQFKVNVHQLNGSNENRYTGGLVAYIPDANNSTHFVVKNVDIIGWNGEFGTSSMKPYIGRAPGEDLSKKNLFVGGVLGYNANSNNREYGIITVFDNVHVYGVNLYGGITAGIVANDGNNKTKVSITNCGVHGKSANGISIDDSATYEIKAYSIAGGIVGHAYNEYSYAGETFTFDSAFTYYNQLNGCSVDNYKIEVISTTSHDGGYASGGILGWSRNNKSIKNLSVKNCVIVVNGSTKATVNGMGGIIGCISKHTINAYNVVVENINFENNASGVNKVPYGLLVGQKSDSLSYIKVAGYTTLGSNRITVAYGDKIGAGDRAVEFDCGRPYDSSNLMVNDTQHYGAGSYVVYSDYEGACEFNNSTIGNRGTTLSTVNGDSNAASVSATDNFPYANSSPSVTIGDKALTGDGIWYETDENGDIVLKADKIINEYNTYYSTNIAKKYSNINSADITAYNSLKEKISTYNTQYGENLLPNDIPVIVLDDPNAVPYESIYAYIRILTNTKYTYKETDKSSVYSITPLKCTYTPGNNETSATLDITGAATVSRNDGNGVLSISGGYDSNPSNPGQFTVLDVQYKDPANTSNVAYHLYIPVYTKKSFDFKFAITALSGTSYYSNSYTGSEHFANLDNVSTPTRGKDNYNIVAENYSTPVTMYLRYEYNVNDIIKDILGGGYGLNWNYDKSLDFIYMLADDNTLPSGTKFVLIDPNKNDKVNYSIGFTASTNADLDITTTNFPGYIIGENTNYSFDDVNFNDLINETGVQLAATPLTAEDVAVAQTSGKPIFHAVPTDENDSDQFEAYGLNVGMSLVRATNDDIEEGTNLYTITGSSLYSAYHVVTFKELLTKRGITFTATSLNTSDEISSAQLSGTPIFHAENKDGVNNFQFDATDIPSDKALVLASSDNITEGTDLYTISAVGGSTLYEDYYLTIIAPADSSDVVHEVNVKSKVTLEHGNCIKANCSKNDNVILMFADLFTKNLSIRTVENDDADKEISSDGQNHVDIQAITSISFNSSGLGDKLNGTRLELRNRNVNIYHSTQLQFERIEADNSMQKKAVDGVTFTLNPASSTSANNYKYNSGVYIKVADGITGGDIFYSSDSETTDRYKRVVSCSTNSDFSGKRITNFYEVINKSNGDFINIRPYLTGETMNDSNNAYEVEIVSNFRMTYNTNGINDQFPLRESGSTAGTIIKGQAALAYQEGDTTYSDNTSGYENSLPLNRKYYRKNASKTSLNYNVLMDSNLASADAQNKTNSVLGINPFELGNATRSSISTWGNYDASQLAGANSATNVKWTISLYRRQRAIVNGVETGDEYSEALPINNYLKNIKVYGVDPSDASKGNEIDLTSSTSTELTYTSSRSSFEDLTLRINPDDANEKTNKFIAYVDYDVITGTELETVEQFYSNYKVILTAELVGDTSSRASDHIVYTNAKLDPTFIDKTAS